jgi:mono/diheme cytochrome c family protein
MKVALAAFSLGLFMAAGTAFAATPDAAGGAEDAKALLQASCTGCHELSVVTEARHSEADWDATLNRMVGNGAVLTPEDIAKLKAYLSANYADQQPAPPK